MKIIRNTLRNCATGMALLFSVISANTAFASPAFTLYLDSNLVASTYIIGAVASPAELAAATQASGNANDSLFGNAPKEATASPSAVSEFTNKSEFPIRTLFLVLMAVLLIWGLKSPKQSESKGRKGNL